MGEKADSAIEKLHARIAELEEERDEQFDRANEWRDQAEKQRMRAEAAESALAQAEARKAETFDALDNIVKGLDGRGYAVKNFPALSVARRRLAATPERTKAAAEILRLATHGAGINFTLVTNAVRRYTEAALAEERGDNRWST